LCRMRRKFKFAATRIATRSMDSMARARRTARHGYRRNPPVPGGGTQQAVVMGEFAIFRLVGGRASNVAHLPILSR
jgi:hypothetical protein